MKCLRCNSRGREGETPKWRWVNSKLVSFRSGFRIHKLNFEIISKWPSSLVQLSSNDHNFLPFFLLHNGHLSSSNLRISLFCLSLRSMSLGSLISSFSPFFDLSKSKVIQFAQFSSLEPEINLQSID